MCSSLFVVACVQTLLFFFFIYCIFRSQTRILLTTIFFCKLCTIFRSTLFINLLSTHIHCCNQSGGTRTHVQNQKLILPIHWGCQTQLKSCDLVMRFRPDLRCTHTWLTSWSWSSPFCLGFTPIAPPSRPLLGNFSSFAILRLRRTLCHFLRRRWWSSNLGTPLLPFFHFLPLLQVSRGVTWTVNIL